MLRSPRRGRAILAAPLSVALMALAACSSLPDNPPERVAFPDDDKPSIDTPIDMPLVIDEAPADLIDLTLFEPLRAALAAGDWMAATLALPHPVVRDAAPTPAPTPTPTPTQAFDDRGAEESANDDARAAADDAADATALWVRYYEARIAMLRGDRETYAATMALLLSQPLPAQLAQEVLRHQLEVAQLAEDAPRELDLCLRLLRAAGPQAPEQEQEQEQEPYRVQIETGLWRALQRLDGEQAQSLRLRGDRELTGWLDLAASAAVPMPGNAVAALTAWTAEYPDHPAALRAASLRDAAINDARTTQLSLLLPLTGPLANASEAVTEGFLAAFYADNSSAISVDVIDSSRFADVGEAYARAQENGASVIVGPLGKREVESLLQRDTMTTPLLTLNRPESGLPVKPGALLLSLAPEDEVEQLAESAWDSGGRRVLLIRPEGSWGTRMEYALRERWTELGGRIPATAVYGKAGSYSDALSAALGLDASTQRSSRVRAVFNERVETLGRRRDDIDTILLLSRTSEEARALKPLINYYYAGDLPVYALSTADSGSSTRNVNRDLSGLQLLAMPWRVSEQGVPGLESADGSSLAALHAMGADAYALARRWWRMRSPAAPTFRGLTATLDAQTDGVLARRLNLAEYQQGALLPR